MARQKLEKYHANAAEFWNLSEQVEGLLSGPYGEILKASPGSFTRHGKLSPALIVTLLLRMVSHGNHLGYKHLLDEFWAEAEDQGVQLPSPNPVSAAAFCKARRRLKPELLREMLHAAGAQTDRSLGPEEARWNGRRVFAVDGTNRTVRLSAELREYFGSAEGSYYPQASVSVLSDVLSGVTYDVWIGPYGCDERAVLLQLIEQLNRGDLLLLDRGYPSYQVIDALVARGIDFVIRMPNSTSWPQFGEFLKSDAMDSVFLLPLKGGAEGVASPAPLLRAVKCPREGDAPMLLLTTLLYSDASADELDDLYRLRWAIEETYKLAKGDYLNQRQMHAKTVEGVEQEILAFHLFLSLSRTMRRFAAKEADEDPRDLSQKAAILSTGRALVALILSHRDKPAAWAAAFARALARIARSLDPRRPDRHFRRRSLQPRQRWCANGRVGLTPELG